MMQRVQMIESVGIDIKVSTMGDGTENDETHVRGRPRR